MGRQTFELLTPCFCAGAYRDKPEMRMPSIRGQLRFWARLLFHDANREITRRAEIALFGGIKASSLPTGLRFSQDAVASRFVLNVALRRAAEARPFCMCPHDVRKGSRNALPPGNLYDLDWSQRASEGSGSEDDLQKVLQCWLLLGGLGGRCNRAAGSIWPCTFKPSKTEFVDAVGNLGLPRDVKVAVLESGDTNAEVLREIATNTVIVRGTQPLGGIDPRKASPLKLKLGRFSGGYYHLIAVWDNRDRRCDLRSAVIELKRGAKPLGEMLNAAFVLGVP